MRRLKHYLKPFLLSLLAAIVLLFVQAYCDLNLPNYMSDIVNTGIQENGIQEKAPNAITTDAMSFMQVFMTSDEVSTVNGDYSLVGGDDTDSNGKAYADTYPTAANVQIYVKDSNLSSDESTNLDNIFGLATWTVIKFFESHDFNVIQTTAQNAMSDKLQDPMQDYINDHIKQPMQDYITSHIQTPMENYITSHISGPMQDYITSHIKQPMQDYITSHISGPMQNYVTSHLQTYMQQQAQTEIAQLTQQLMQQNPGMTQQQAEQEAAQQVQQQMAAMQQQMQQAAGSGDMASMIASIPDSVLTGSGLGWLKDVAGAMSGGSVSANVINEIPDEILQQANLEWLKDAMGALSGGSGSISGMSGVINEIPDEILQQANLEWLKDFVSASSGSGSMSADMINEIPDEILQQANLEWLKDFSSLSSGSGDISNMSGVINEIPDEILQQANLEWLKDFANAMNTLKNSGSDTKDFSGLSSAFKEVPDSILQQAGLPWLKTVDFNSMQSGDFSGFSSDNSDDSDSSDDSTVDISNMDLSQLYQFAPMIKLLPQSWFDDARTQALTVDQSIRDQSATMMTQNFYKELGMDMQSIELGYIIRIGLFMLLMTLISGTSTVLVGLISARVGTGVARNLRHDVFKKVESFSHTEFDRFSAASLITRSTNDVMQIQMFIAIGIRMIFYAPIIGIGATFMALNKSISMGWILALAVIVLLGVVITLLIVVIPKFKIMQRLYDRLNLVAREALNGLMVIRAFGRQDFEQKRFGVANNNLYKTNLFIQRAMVFLMPVMTMFMNGLTVLIIWIGANEVSAGTMQTGDMMAYMQYAMQVVMGFMFIAMAFIFMPRASVSAGRIADVLETEPVIVDPETPVDFDEDARGEVEFKHVSFRFENADGDAVTDISFTAHPGQTTAFIGSTGSGKSTILNLIPRFYDVTEGSITVDGVDIRDVTQKSLRARIGYVPQKSVLMAGDIASNIAYGTDEMPPEDMQKVAEVSQAMEFIMAKEDGFESEISPAGSNVSGGQRQRLSIARALAIHPEILLFDDSFSALDMKTDAVLRKALAEYTNDTTMIIVAQRVSTIMDAEQIYVVDEGHVVGHGTHAQLLKTCPAYYEIASSQLSPEELEASAQDGNGDNGDKKDHNVDKDVSDTPDASSSRGGDA
jgi:ATP-binding cassette subfamily B protein